LKKVSKDITASQYIAPQRLFVNSWRTIRNSYVDETLNGQDWAYWKNRYFKQVKTLDDANVAINSMLASLNDPYSKFLLSNSFARQKMVIDSKISGIGVLFDKAGDEVVINHVFANSSAATENIQAGDAIVNINGQNANDISMEKLVEELTSGAKEKVEITIRRDNL
jgi:carboxyl-terminal processing protease